MLPSRPPPIAIDVAWRSNETVDATPSPPVRLRLERYSHERPFSSPPSSKLEKQSAAVERHSTLLEEVKQRCKVHNDEAAQKVRRRLAFAELKNGQSQLNQIQSEENAARRARAHVEAVKERAKRHNEQARERVRARRAFEHTSREALYAATPPLHHCPSVSPALLQHCPSPSPMTRRA